mmetsp:Transcript_120599/g.209961  ORF Transcript_120599/g.209961 Transcript_120599/m.209961 type:complete len:358 (+) Transcript_120599:256-1329(+)
MTNNTTNQNTTCQGSVNFSLGGSNDWGRARCRWWDKRQRGVVGNNPQRPLRILEERPGLVHFGDSPILVRHDDVAHGDSSVAINQDCSVFHFHLTPTLERKASVGWVGGVVTHEVRKGALARGAEGLVPSGQCGLEEHRPKLVAIGRVDDLTCQLLGGWQALIVEGRGNVDKGLAPTLLGCKHLRLGNAGGGGRQVGQRRVVGHDAHVAVGILLEGPGLVNGRGIPVLVGDVHVAYTCARAAVQEDGGVFDLDLAPALQGKAPIVGVLGVTADEVGQRALAGGPEDLVAGGQGGLEQHGGDLVAIAPIDHGLSHSLGSFVTLIVIGGGDVHQALAPALLGCQHLLLGDWRRGNIGQR